MVVSVSRLCSACSKATVHPRSVNAVMAACRPEYLPLVIAGVEAMCDEAFDLHGVSATTSFSPLSTIHKTSFTPRYGSEGYSGAHCPRASSLRVETSPPGLTRRKEAPGGFALSRR